MASSEAKSIAKSAWWLFILSGVLSVLFGLFAVFWPGLTVSILVHIFGLFIVAIGVAWLVMSFADMKTNRVWWLSALLAIFAVVAGIYLLANPSTTITIFVILVATVVFARALVDLIGASYAGDASSRWMWILLGVLGVVFGVVILVYPKSATTAFVWVVGLYAVIRGIADIIYAFRVKKNVKKLVKASKNIAG